MVTIYKKIMVAVLVLIIAAAKPEAIGQESTGRAPQEFEIESGETFYGDEDQILEVSVESEVGDERFRATRSGKPAPHCVYAYKSKGAIQVQNDCPDGWRVKVKVRFALDTGCKWVEPGTRTNIGIRPGVPIDGVILC